MMLPWYRYGESRASAGRQISQFDPWRGASKQEVARDTAHLCTFVSYTWRKSPSLVIDVIFTVDYVMPVPWNELDSKATAAFKAYLRRHPHA